ncbi:hypothetical protein GCM10010399_35200 [Dactylosporangium fulvum]
MQLTAARPHDWSIRQAGWDERTYNATGWNFSASVQVRGDCNAVRPAPPRA